jgi:hypothetical protein
MFLCVKFGGSANGTGNGGESLWAKKELFTGISHIFIISKFDYACFLRVCDGGVVPKVIRGFVIYIIIISPFADLGK